MLATKDNNYLYNADLKDRARELRQSMTKPEACLWKYVIRAGKMKAYGFHRQRPVLYYVADFFCSELMLIIEVDGGHHYREDHLKRDKERTQNLEAAGFRVVRFRNDEVLEHIESVRRLLDEVVTEIEAVYGDRSRELWRKDR